MNDRPLDGSPRQKQAVKGFGGFSGAFRNPPKLSLSALLERERRQLCFDFVTNKGTSST